MSVHKNIAIKANILDHANIMKKEGCSAMQHEAKITVDDVFYKLTTDGYRPSMPCPEKPRDPTRNVRMVDLTSNDLVEYVEQKKQYESAMEEFKKKVEEYNKHAREVDTFHSDAFEALGWDLNDPIAQKFYSLAYEQGHASGYYEVFSHMRDFDDVMQEIKKNYVRKDQ